MAVADLPRPAGHNSSGITRQPRRSKGTLRPSGTPPMRSRLSVMTWSPIHNEAKSNVEGVPHSGMDGATSEAKTKSTNLYRRAIVAGGALQVYSGAIEAFNDSVDGWNRKINAADDDEKAEKIYANHTGDYTAAVETLEDAATTGKSQLTTWHDDKTVKILWAAGALPSSATAMLPGIGLEYSD